MGEAGSTRSGSDFVLWWSLATCILDSEVRRGLEPEPSIPNPTAEVSRCSGRISPKSRPGALGEEGGKEGDLCCRFVIDLDACAMPVAEVVFRGLAIRLAKDCELFDN